MIMEVVLAAGRRTPHGKLLGQFKDVGAVELGATAIRGVMDASDISEDALDWVSLGHSIQAGAGQVPARQAALKAGIPKSVPATTINEASGSGLRAILLAIDRIYAGKAERVIAGGMESMSNAPYLLPAFRQGRKHGNSEVIDAMVRDALWDMQYDAHMGTLTEDLVERFDIAREEQDTYALKSHRRAVSAIENGSFEKEIMPVNTNGEKKDEDEGPRPDTDMEKLSQLDPFFSEEGTITAGNASDLSDGAGAVLVAEKEAAEASNAAVMAHVVDYGVAYRDPKWFPLAIEDAVQDLMERNDLAVEDVDVFEINEAFAAHLVHFTSEVGVPHEKLNLTGGAIALGHPIGASGGILTTTIMHTMERESATYGIVGMCVGGGGGIALLLRR